jgi:hydroxymethylpyrimidine pyrophosphatase-like HAD family hydrolase
VEVLGPGIDKAAGVAWVADALGIDASATIAFGDDRPDIPMLAWAGRGVAVADAHPDVLEIADDVCASVDEDGVAQVLEALLSSSADRR